jgi:hypothetical protein
MSARVMRRLPPALLLGAVLSLVTSMTFLLVRSLLVTGADRWYFSTLGLELAEHVFLAAGLWQVSRQMAGKAQRDTRAVAIATGVLAAMYFSLILVDSAPPALLVLRAISVLKLGCVVVLLTSARSRRYAWPGAVLCLGSLVVTELLPLISPMTAYAMGPVVWTGADAAWIVGLVLLVVPRSEARDDGGPDWQLAGRGFSLCATGFRLLVAAVLLRSFLSPFVAKYFHGSTNGPIAPLAALLALPMLAWVIVAWGLLRIAAARVGARAVYYLGAAGVLWSAGTSFVASVALSKAMYQIAVERLPISNSLPQWLHGVWNEAVPLVGAGAVALIGAAVMSLASSMGNTALRRAAALFTSVFLVLSAGGQILAANVMIGDPGGPGLLVLVSNLLAPLAMAALFARAAQGVASGRGLPEARVV